MVPTTLLSNHLHYPTIRGSVLDAELVRDLLTGVEERGLVDACGVDFVRRAKARNPKLLYLCDPVMGDADPGFYSPKTCAPSFVKALFR